MAKFKNKFVKKGDKLCPECLCDRHRYVLTKLREFDYWPYGHLIVWKCHWCKSKLVSGATWGPELALEWI